MLPGVLSFRGIPLSMWPECILTTVYLSSVLSGISPYFLVYGKDQCLSLLRSLDGDSDDCNIIVEDEVAGVATQIEDNVTSEGNVENNQNGDFTLILVVTHGVIHTLYLKKVVTFTAKRSMFEISGNNFNDWFLQLKMVLRVERKLFVIEQPISLASPTDSEYLRSGMRYMIHNEMKNYVELECLGYVLPQELKCWFNLEWPHYNKHNMGKTVGELHAMLIEYEKGLPKKAETPQVMMIKGGKIQKSNKKSLKAKGKGKANGKGKDKQVYIPKPKNLKPSAKEHLAKDDTCHHCKEVGHCKRNCPAYLAELIKKKKQVGTASSSDVFIIELFSFPTKS
ncbi:retrotransposon protein, putative, ty1-copia subclass [Tanacetum coccineum]